MIDKMKIKLLKTLAGIKGSVKKIKRYKSIY